MCIDEGALCPVCVVPCVWLNVCKVCIDEGALCDVCVVPCVWLIVCNEMCVTGLG